MLTYFIIFIRSCCRTAAAKGHHMKQNRWVRLPAAAVWIAATVWILAAGSAYGQGDILGVRQNRVETGESVQVEGKDVSTWASFDGNGEPVQVGVSVAYGIISSPPIEPGEGPAGAIAVVRFPEAARSSTVLDHFELHWEREGHPPATFQLPHFDLHAYRIPEAEVARIVPPDSAAPAENRIPAGYVYIAEEIVPQMGVHAVDPQDLGKAFDAVMILGYFGGEMIFVEPMITQELLAKKQDFSLNVPVPGELGRSAWYPTSFAARYDQAADAYHFVFEDFIEID